MQQNVFTIEVKLKALQNPIQSHSAETIFIVYTVCLNSPLVNQVLCSFNRFCTLKG